MQDSEIGAVVKFLMRNWTRMLVAASGAAVLGLVYALVVPAYYAATATLVVENRRPRPVSELPQYVDEPGYVDTQVATIQSDLILRHVVAALDLANDGEFNGAEALFTRWYSSADVPKEYRQERTATARLRRTLAASRVGVSHVVELTARSRDPEKAALIANAVALRFVEDQRAFAEKITERANAPTATRIIGQASRPLEKASPGTLTLTGAGFIAGLLMSAVALAAREAVSPRFASAAQIESVTGRACAGSLGAPGSKRLSRVGGRRLRKKGRRFASAAELVAHAEHASSGFALGLRRLAFVLEETAGPGHPVVVGFASATRNLERPLAAANMALLLAQMGKRTLLVDAASPFGAVKTGDANEGSSIWTVSETGLDVLGPKGMVGPGGGPEEWLKAALDAAMDVYQCVIVDLPPVLDSGYAPYCMKYLQSTILLITLQSDSQSDVMEALRVVEQGSSGGESLVACVEPAFKPALFKV